MEMLVSAAQLLIAGSVLFVWVFRFENIVKEFREYGYSDLFRNLIGAAKVALSTLLIVAMWRPEFASSSALAMAALMLGAQVSHFRARHAPLAYAPSFALLALSLFVAVARSGWDV